MVDRLVASLLGVVLFGETARTTTRPAFAGELGLLSLVRRS